MGGAAEANISLTVLHGPVISLEQQTLHRGRGLRLELECRVEAEPRPEVRWYKDTMLLDPSHSRQMEIREGNRSGVMICDHHHHINDVLSSREEHPDDFNAKT